MYGQSNYRSYNDRYSDDYDRRDQLTMYETSDRMYDASDRMYDTSDQMYSTRRSVENDSRRFDPYDREVSNFGGTSRSGNYNTDLTIRSRSQDQTSRSRGQSFGQSNRSLEDYTTPNNYERMSSLDNYRERKDELDVSDKKNVYSFERTPIKLYESYSTDWGAPANTFDSYNSNRNPVGRMTRDILVGQEPLMSKRNKDFDMESKTLPRSDVGRTTKPRNDVISSLSPRRSNQPKNVDTGFNGGVRKRRPPARNKLTEKRQTSTQQSLGSKLRLQSMSSVLSAETDRRSLKLKEELDRREKQLFMASNLLTKQTQLLHDIESNIHTKFVVRVPEMAPGKAQSSLSDSYLPKPVMNRLDSMPPRTFAESGSHEPWIDQQGQSDLGISKQARKKMRRRLRKKGIASQDLAQQSSRMPMKRGIDQGGDMMVSMAPPTKKVERETSHDKMSLLSMDLGMDRPKLFAKKTESKKSDSFLPKTNTGHSNSRKQKMKKKRISRGCNPCGIINFASLEDCCSHFKTPEHLLVMKYVKKDLTPKTKFHKVNVTPEKFTRAKSFGAEYFGVKTGMFCHLCNKFFQFHEQVGKTHLQTKAHYLNWVKDLKLKKFEELLKAEMNEKNKGKDVNGNNGKETTTKIEEESGGKSSNEKSDPEQKNTVETKSEDTVDCQVEKEMTSDNIPMKKNEEKEDKKSTTNGDEHFAEVVGNEATENVEVEGKKDNSQNQTSTSDGEAPSTKDTKEEEVTEEMPNKPDVNN